MPAKGDGLTKRKDGRYMTRYTVQTSDGSKPAWRDVSLVFPNRIGGPTDHNNLYYREYKPLLKRVRLADGGFTFHTLIRTFATALLIRREHPKVIQSLLGHSSVTQTMDTYSHLMNGIGGDVVDGLNEAFG